MIASLAWKLRSFPQFRAFSALTMRAKIRDGVGMPKGLAHAKSRYILEIEQLSGLPAKEPFLVLGIESSCDDTGVAIVSSDGRILSNIVYSQYNIHDKFGGVVPGLAMEAHKSNIDIAISRALSEAGYQSINDIDAIAVTKGPGLEICLRVGCRKAQSLAKEYNKPFVTIHHLEAHCLIARLAGQHIIPDSNTSITQSIVSEQVAFQPKIDFPFLTLLASGGHTSLMLCKGLGDFDLIGGTLDDALGEAFDKAARLLGLQSNISGGAAVELLAKQYSNSPELHHKFNHSMSVPMRDKPNCDFSYAGLKNAFRREVFRFRSELGLDLNSTNAPQQQMETVNLSELVRLPPDVTSFLCYSFQDIAFQHVEDRLKRALNFLSTKNTSVNGLVVVGGVAANLELRQRLLTLLDKHSKKTRKDSIPLMFPPVSLCTDNGVMAAWAGIEKLKVGISNAIEGQEVIARWPLGLPMVDRPKHTPRSLSVFFSDAEQQSKPVSVEVVASEADAVVKT